MRAMGIAPERRTLVELKAVDATYPLYGAVALEPEQDLQAALALRDGRWGAAADPVLLQQLGLEIGDTIRVGDLDYAVRATVAREPDRVTSLFSFGPRLLVADATSAERHVGQEGVQTGSYRCAPDY